MIETSLYSVNDILINAILGIMMLGVGLTLRAKDFKNVFAYPKPLLTGLASQIIILPLIAFTIAYFSNMPAVFRIGLIILAACPGGTTSGIITYLFNGNVALSISFTCINSLLVLISLPLIVNMSLDFYLGKSTIIHLSYADTIIQIVSITVIPVLTGVLIRRYFPETAEKVQNSLKIIMVIALAIVFAILFFAGEEYGGTGITSGELFEILPYALLLNLMCLAWGLLLGLVTRIGIKNSYTISIEASVHNTILAFLVAGTLLNNPDMEKPALVYAMFSFWTAVIYSLAISRLIRKGYFLKFTSVFDTIS